MAERTVLLDAIGGGYRGTPRPDRKRDRRGRIGPGTKKDSVPRRPPVVATEIRLEQAMQQAAASQLAAERQVADGSRPVQ